MIVTEKEYQRREAALRTRTETWDYPEWNYLEYCSHQKARMARYLELQDKIIRSLAVRTTRENGLTVIHNKKEVQKLLFEN